MYIKLADLHLLSFFLIIKSNQTIYHMTVTAQIEKIFHIITKIPNINMNVFSIPISCIGLTFGLGQKHITQKKISKHLVVVSMVLS